MEEEKDITETGPVGLKGLEGLAPKRVAPRNNVLFKNASHEDRMKMIENSGMSNEELLMYENSMPTIHQAHTDLKGHSIWDKDAYTATELARASDIRAYNLPTFMKWLNGAGKMVVTTGTTFLDGTFGLLYGIGLGIYNLFDDDEKTTFLSGLWQNGFNNAMADILELSEEYLPNYYTKYELEAPWYNNIFTANFWADGILKNAGFILGAAGSALVGTGIFSAIGKGLGWGAKLTSLAASASGKTAKFLSGTGKALNTAGKVTTILANTFVSANGESTIEALLSVRENKKNIDNNVLYFLQLYQERAYADLNERIANGEDPKAALLIYEDTLNKIKGELDTYKLQEYQKLTDAGNSIYGLNLLFLSLTNSISLSSFIRGGFKLGDSFRRNIAKTVDGKIVNSTKEFVEGIGKGTAKYTAKNASKEMGKSTGAAVGRYFLNSASEGFLEGALALISSANEINTQRRLNAYSTGKNFFTKKDFMPTTKKVLSIMDISLNPNVNKYVKGLAGSYLLALEYLFGSFGSPGWKEVMMGAISSGLALPGVGMHTSIDSKTGETKLSLGFEWIGGIAEAMRDVKGDKEKFNNQLDILNSYITNDETKLKFQHATTALGVNWALKIALDEGDVLSYKNGEIANIVNDAIFFRNLGMLDEYTSFFDAFADNVSDQDVQELIAATRGENGKSALEGKTTDEIKKIYSDKAKSYKSKIHTVLDSFEKYASIVEKTYAPEYQGIITQEAAFKSALLKDSKRRISELEEEITKIDDTTEEGKIEIANKKVAINDLKKLASELDEYLKDISKNPEKITQQVDKNLARQYKYQIRENVLKIKENLEKATSIKDVVEIYSYADASIRNKVFEEVKKEGSKETKELLDLFEAFISDVDIIATYLVNKGNISLELAKQFKQSLDYVISQMLEGDTFEFNKGTLAKNLEKILENLKQRKKDLESTGLTHSNRYKENSTNIEFIENIIPFFKDAEAIRKYYKEHPPKISIETISNLTSSIPKDSKQENKHEPKEKNQKESSEESKTAMSGEEAYDKYFPKIRELDIICRITIKTMNPEDLEKEKKKYMSFKKTNHIGRVIELNERESDLIYKEDDIKNIENYIKLLEDYLLELKAKVGKNSFNSNVQEAMSGIDAFNKYFPITDEIYEGFDKLKNLARHNVKKDIIPESLEEDLFKYYSSVIHLYLDKIRPSLRVNRQNSNIVHSAEKIRFIENSLYEIKSNLKIFENLISGNKVTSEPEIGSASKITITTISNPEKDNANPGDFFGGHTFNPYKREELENHKIEKFEDVAKDPIFQAIQDIIDYGLKYIPNLKDIDIHYIKTKENKYNNVLFLGIEYTDDIINSLPKHIKSFIEPLIKLIDGKTYLLIGTLGYTSDSNKSAFFSIYNTMETASDNSNEDWVVSTKTNRIKDITEGYIISNDENKFNSLKEMLNSPTANPDHLDISDLKFAVNESSEELPYKIEKINVRPGDILHDIPKSLPGQVYLYIPTSRKGVYVPIQIDNAYFWKEQRDIYKENPESEKLNPIFLSIIDTIKDIVTSNNSIADKLLTLTNLFSKIILPIGNYIKIRDNGEIYAKVNNAQAKTIGSISSENKQQIINDILEVLDRQFPRFTINASTLASNPDYYIDSGLLKIKTDCLHTMGANTFVYSTDSENNAVITTPAPQVSNHMLSKIAAKEITFNTTTFSSYDGETFYDEEGNLITDVNTQLKLRISWEIINNKKVPKTLESKPNTLYFIIDNNTIFIMDSRGSVRLLNSDEVSDFKRVYKKELELKQLKDLENAIANTPPLENPVAEDLWDNDKTDEKLKKRIEHGKKLIKKVINELKEAKTIIEKLNAVLHFYKSVQEGAIVTKELQLLIDEAVAEAKAQGYEIVKLEGTRYHEGMKEVNAEFRNDESLEPGVQIIRFVNKPFILKDGKLVLAAEIIVIQSPWNSEEEKEADEMSHLKGQKQLLSAIKLCKEAKTPIDKLNAILRFNNNIQQAGALATKKQLLYINDLIAELKKLGYEIEDNYIGKNYDEGIKCFPHFMPDDYAEPGSLIIYRVMKPLIKKDGKIVQFPTLMVKLGPPLSPEAQAAQNAAYEAKRNAAMKKLGIKIPNNTLQLIIPISEAKDRVKIDIIGTPRREAGLDRASKHNSGYDNLEEKDSRSGNTSLSIPSEFGGFAEEHITTTINGEEGTLHSIIINSLDGAGRSGYMKLKIFIPNNIAVDEDSVKNALYAFKDAVIENDKLSDDEVKNLIKSYDIEITKSKLKDPKKIAKEKFLKGIDMFGFNTEEYNNANTMFHMDTPIEIDKVSTGDILTVLKEDSEGKFSIEIKKDNNGNIIEFKASSKSKNDFTELPTVITDSIPELTNIKNNTSLPIVGFSINKNFGYTILIKDINTDDIITVSGSSAQKLVELKFKEEIKYLAPTILGNTLNLENNNIYQENEGNSISFAKLVGGKKELEEVNNSGAPYRIFEKDGKYYFEMRTDSNSYFSNFASSIDAKTHGVANVLSDFSSKPTEAVTISPGELTKLGNKWIVLKKAMIMIIGGKYTMEEAIKKREELAKKASNNINSLSSNKLNNNSNEKKTFVNDDKGNLKSTKDLENQKNSINFANIFNSLRKTNREVFNAVRTAANTNSTEGIMKFLVSKNIDITNLQSEEDLLNELKCKNII